MTEKRLRNIWNCMKQRCENPNHTAARWYHNRGIRVCKEWQDYETFRTWAIENGYKDNLTIDRKDPDGNYEPYNCRWITRAENCRKARRSGTVTERRKRKKKPKNTELEHFAISLKGMSVNQKISLIHMMADIEIADALKNDN